MLPIRDLSSGWQTFEVAVGADENFQTPFFAALSASGSLPCQPITKMRMIEMLGWPEARIGLKDSKGERIIVKKDDRIWLVKCKPTCWRLYCYVIEQKRFIVYVHAVCKKQNKEDPRDLVDARSVADRIRPGGDRITPFQFPKE